MNRKWIGLGVVLIGAVALTIVGWLNWKHGQVHPSTENAYVTGDVTSVASRVPGTLAEILFREDEIVQAGQLLARLDVRDFDAAVARAEAELAKLEATLTLDEAQIAGAEAQVAVARSQATQARADRDRFAALSQRGSAPARQSEQAGTAAAVAEAQVTAAAKALLAARARLEVDRGAAAKSRAEREQALLQRSYCDITAPVTGVVADKSSQVGQVIGAGQPLCRLAPLQDGHLWVEANFKETQLQRIAVGQPATVEIDAVKGHEFKGRVAALSAGTGAAFSLLPPENASGNWVKIVQRLPVRIDLDTGDPLAARLRLGLSAAVSVDTRGGGADR
jgi:membrane fusion protein, multidrug efflux system